jgi:hypothetical protein
MAKFGSLWVGGPLTKIQEISLSSFVYHGHEITLFVYDMDMVVPDGVVKSDASAIMSEDDIFLVQNTYAAFSDLFRYQMIDKTGLAWVDADTVCLSPDWNFKDNIYAGLEKDKVTGGVLCLPQGSGAIKYLIKKSTGHDKTKIKWTEVGPALVNATFHKYNLMDYAYSQETFCGIHWSEWEKLWDPKHLREIKKLEKTSKSISVYHSMTTRGGIDKNTMPPGSAMEYFYNKFVKKVAE